MTAKLNGVISNAIYQQINLVSKRTASTEMTDLVNKKILVRIGLTGRGTEYVLWGNQPKED